MSNQIINMENTEIELLIKKIVEENEKQFGKIQSCCNMYKKYCRCGVETEILKCLENPK